MPADIGMFTYPSYPWLTYPFWMPAEMLIRFAAIHAFGFRIWGTEHLSYAPPKGGYLILANHQSHLDPPLVGACLGHMCSYLARDNLFGMGAEDNVRGPTRIPLLAFAALIRYLNAIPIARTRMDRGSFERMQASLDKNLPIVLFPEGTRTKTGEVQEFKRGIELMARRFNVPILPVGLEGTFQCWPSGASPLQMHLRPIHICLGAPIPPEEFNAWPRSELGARLRERVVAMHAKARARRTAVVGEAKAAAELRRSRALAGRKRERSA